ncbi:MAG: hypothetical protein ACLSGS_06385 [Adlercreutzia sp.]
MREEDEIRAAVIELARAQAAGEDIADALPHGEALATAGAAADGEAQMTPRSRAGASGGHSGSA